MEPKIIDNLDNQEYHHSEMYRPYYSSSQIKNYLISPKYARYSWLHPEEKKTEAMEFGSVYHAMLESLVNSTEMPYIAFSGPVNPSTGKAYGADSAKYRDAEMIFISENPGKMICSEAQLLTATEMVEQLLTGNDNLSPVINTFIKHGKAEQSHLVEYQGGLFKYRTDLKTRNLIVDWKTCGLEVPKPEEFERQIINFGYHISAAMYQFMEKLVTGKWKKFYWVVQEKEPPYDFTIIDASNWAWDVNVYEGVQVVEPGPGALIFMKLLEQHLICLERNEWPGYSIFTQPDWKGRRIATPEPPAWYRNKMFNFIN